MLDDLCFLLTDFESLFFSTSGIPTCIVYFKVRSFDEVLGSSVSTHSRNALRKRRIHSVPSDIPGDDGSLKKHFWLQGRLTNFLPSCMLMPMSVALAVAVHSSFLSSSEPMSPEPPTWLRRFQASSHPLALSVANTFKQCSATCHASFRRKRCSHLVIVSQRCLSKRNQKFEHVAGKTLYEFLMKKSQHPLSVP